MTEADKFAHTYSVLDLHRGAFISVAVLLLIIISYFLGLISEQIIQCSPLTSVAVIIFFVFNLMWDYKIKLNHLNFELIEEGVVFCKENDRMVIEKSTIVRIEHFPDANNIYDEDFIENMMSSGIRLITRDKKKYLIFSKVSGFQVVKGVLERWAAELKS